MKMQILLLSGLFLSLIACNKTYYPADIPECLKKEIQRRDKLDCGWKGSVDEYVWKGQTVYWLSPSMCGADLSSPVVDQNCNVICELGGFSGTIICDGDTFSKAIFVQTIWKQ